MKRITSILTFFLAAIVGISLFFLIVGRQRLIERSRYKEVQLQTQLFKKAIRYETEGRLLEAKGLLQKIISSFPNAEIVSKAQNKLGELNIRIIFSPILTAHSFLYEVKPGDTLEKIAKDFSTTVELIKRSNAIQSDFIRPGERLKVYKATFSVIIDKSQNRLILKLNEEPIKSYLVSTGMNNTTPTGSFKVVNKLINPTWYKAGAVVRSGSPENILGSRWLGLSVSGYGIHGTTQPHTVGKHITKGCIRMLNKDVEELYDILPIGTEVTIVD